MDRSVILKPCHGETVNHTSLIKFFSSAPIAVFYAPSLKPRRPSQWLAAGPALQSEQRGAKPPAHRHPEVHHGRGDRYRAPQGRAVAGRVEGKHRVAVAHP